MSYSRLRLNIPLSSVSFGLYVWFWDHCLSFCIFSFGHCVVCSSSILDQGSENFNFEIKIIYLSGHRGLLF